jgi:hypothetical protein
MTADRRAPTGAADKFDAAISRALVNMALVGADQPVTLTPLTGGVSSDIFRADLPSGPVCVKRALPKLKVAADWRAPVERNHWEVEWMRVAATIAPASVPEILGEDRQSGCFAMAFLPPDRYPVWKTLLRDGVIDRASAAAVGDTLGCIHAATADRPDIATRFPTDAIFDAIRLEPYLSATARAHPDLAPRSTRSPNTTRDEARARPRRFQPEEPADRARRPRDPRRRVRVVRRSGVRPCRSC